MAIFTTESTEIKNQLVRRGRGFEVVGIVGDNCQKPRVYTIHGDLEKLTKREREGIKTLSFEKRGKGDLIQKLTPSY